MKNLSFVTAFVTTALVASLASAQAPSQIDRGVAVVDLKYIFDKFPWFTQQKEQVDNEIKAAEAEITADKKHLEELKAERDKCRKGTPEYTARDAQFTKAQIELGAKVQQTRKRFVEREANIYFNAYKHIVAEVEAYASHMGYSMVLRFNKDVLTEGEEGEARKVALLLNKPVVWLKANNPNNIYDPANRDITQGVLEMLIRRTNVSATSRAPAVPVRPTRQ